MNNKVDNLIKYFIKLYENNVCIEGARSTFSKTVNEKTIDLRENEFKNQVTKFLIDSDGKTWVDPIDILIMSIESLEKIMILVNLKNCNKFTILWIMCMLNAKCMSSHDHEHKLSFEFLSNLGGFQLKDYIYFEKIILQKLDWRLEISDENYKRLYLIALGY
jgi:hypothetical protein